MQEHSPTLSFLYLTRFYKVGFQPSAFETFLLMKSGCRNCASTNTFQVLHFEILFFYTTWFDKVRFHNSGIQNFIWWKTGWRICASTNTFEELNFKIPFFSQNMVLRIWISTFGFRILFLTKIRLGNLCSPRYFPSVQAQEALFFAYNMVLRMWTSKLRLRNLLGSGGCSCLGGRCCSYVGACADTRQLASALCATCMANFSARRPRKA